MQDGVASVQAYNTTYSSEQSEVSMVVHQPIAELG